MAALTPMNTCVRLISIVAIVPVLLCSEFASGELPDGMKFELDQPPLDVAAATSKRDAGGRNRSDVPILIMGQTIEESSFVFFSTGADCQDGDVRPAIARFRDGEWRTVAFAGVNFTSHIWLSVYESYVDRDRLYAISVSQCEGGSAELFVYRSADGGTIWSVTAIKKYYLAEFLSLRIESDGLGELIVRTKNDADPVGGHHVYRTADWGATWSDPSFSETVLRPPIYQHYYFKDYVPVTTHMNNISKRFSADGN